MDNIVNLEQWKSEREQRRISPILRQAEEMRRVARMLMLNAEIMEMEAYGMADIDYDVPPSEKVAELEALHNA